MEISIPCVYSCGMKTNDNTGGAENFGTWADEAILLGWAAHVPKKSMILEFWNWPINRYSYSMFVNIHA